MPRRPGVDAEEAAGGGEDRGVVRVETQGAVARRDVAHLDGHRAAREEEEIAVVVRLVRAGHPLEAELGVPVDADDVAVGEHGLGARADSGRRGCRPERTGMLIRAATSSSALETRETSGCAYERYV